MRIQAAFVILAQIGVLLYAVWAVHHRNDRRKVPHDLTRVLHGLGVFALLILIGALALFNASEGRRFLAVREIF